MKPLPKSNFGATINAGSQQELKSGTPYKDLPGRVNKNPRLAEDDNPDPGKRERKSLMVWNSQIAEDHRMLQLRICELRAGDTAEYTTQIVKDENVLLGAGVRGLRSAVSKLEQEVKNGDGSEAEERARLNTSQS
jgi:hypothetical protein